MTYYRLIDYITEKLIEYRKEVLEATLEDLEIDLHNYKVDEFESQWKQRKTRNLIQQLKEQQGSDITEC